MELHTPNYYSKFHCLAGACPHTCCAWWEVPVDPAAAEFYRSLPGRLGDRLRATLTKDENGEACFLLTGGHCPFLDGEGLCSLMLELGEEHIPHICGEHPRFTYDYGPVREVGLCASCPEVARLVLEEDFSLAEETCPGGEEGQPLLEPLLVARQLAFDLLEADAPLSARLQALLLLGNDLQNALDRENPAVLAEVCQVYDGQLPLLEGVTLPPREDSLKKVLEQLKSLTILQPEWAALLEAGLARLAAGEGLPKPPEAEGGRAAAYFVYRHWLRSLNDADLLTWCELAVLGTEAAGALAPLVEGGFPEAFRRFCLEVEHAQVNLDALQDALWDTLALADLLALAD